MGGQYLKIQFFTSLFIAYGAFMRYYILVLNISHYRMVALIFTVTVTFYLFFLGTGRTGQLLFIMLLALFIW